ncbi:conserved hypothetical protein, PP_1857 family [Oceanospirillum multiglobuliferum]|uniref:Protein-arginine rhamnosyltransferase n=1 Tax=Oceanospirillum multiglobuliferum TaxID=64969 RepID=A0A1T4P1Z2_9GAMM|nr:elongation factor P maturation arginine rhamnosyltransferase EarP [Oceanospirillum multiglobuliferum]OPX55104.1 hypothetical protein BTE48_10770 [Oceanospirillum multiglobuliferum]SJZ85422.1 conserved hypothetical protein, PP_1857 family [Oceanospirillum multiglobuliferum]
MNKAHWDIFCQVIDNYGDIGVCWRLARQLAAEYPVKVRLWVDELAALKQIWPETQLQSQQYLEQVEVCVWSENFPAEVKPADVVIEAFACELPTTYLAAMQVKAQPSVWLNLEYLSAEDWVEGCHKMLSMHPSTGMNKTFFFPGFTEKTGGILREKTLLEHRAAFQGDYSKQDAFFSQLGLDQVNQRTKETLLVSLFAYENTAVASLIHTWQQSKTPVMCLVPFGKILTSLNPLLNKPLEVGQAQQIGALTLIAIPFVSQQEYDHLLWACDLNFIRGEDSFVRAQWAAKPMVWHIYPQDEDYHMVKLNAFLAHYLAKTEPMLQSALSNLWQVWNQGGDVSEHWQTCLKLWPQWQRQSQSWCKQLSQQNDLSSQLFDFCQKRATEKG